MKTSKCNKNCGCELYFSDSVTSQNGKKIPLEVEYKPDDLKKEYPQFNGKHHNCPNSSYAQKSATNANSQSIGITKLIVKDYNVTEVDAKLLKSEERYHRLATIQARDRYESLDPSSSVGGQIVNAICNRLVKIDGDKK